MSKNPAQALIDFRPTKQFFVGIDSDGCVFDTMELKHKECFIPNVIKHFGLQPVAKYARDVAAFVNLYSTWRGCNRFPALIKTIDLLAEHPEAKRRDVSVPSLTATRAWLNDEPKPSNESLKVAIAKSSGDAQAELMRLLAWSEAVNATIADMVYGMPPFPGVRQSIIAAADHADLMVVSATPAEALNREWAEHDLSAYVAVIAGQEMGTKAEHLKLAAGSSYQPGNVLMVGDAPGDLKAARANGVLFHPINPGAEEESWRLFFEESLARFIEGSYAGDYEAKLIAEFEVLLPDIPPWQNNEASTTTV